MVRDRSAGRNVHIYRASEYDRALGGLILNPSVTERIFLFMLEILIVSSDPYEVVMPYTGVIVTPTDEPLKPGHYDIKSKSQGGMITFTDEPCITRVYSRTRSGRNETFRNEVRERDGKCVITGRLNKGAYRNDWTGFEAAHVFSLSHGQLFKESGFSRWITNRVSETDLGINSCQNGLLMLSSVHQLFDSFLFSINPDDNYRIVSFDDDSLEVDGRILDATCRRKRSVLRWHFRQAVFANMRGAGEPIFETDFPPGSDMMGEIIGGPEAAKRMETELFLRMDEVS
ncbi:HNH endonuclease-domain-containing protein [Lipomyces doorenjongii]